jgi:predicted nucleic acid-binding protein
MVINQYIAVLDACVLAPMPLADTLLRLAEEPAFYVPRWSGDILKEVAITLAKFGYSSQQINRRVMAMETSFEDALITGYEDLVPAMRNDPKDRHVLAAAVRTGAHAIGHRQ